MTLEEHMYEKSSDAEGYDSYSKDQYADEVSLGHVEGDESVSKESRRVLRNGVEATPESQNKTILYLGPGQNFGTREFNIQLARGRVGNFEAVGLSSHSDDQLYDCLESYCATMQKAERELPDLYLLRRDFSGLLAPKFHQWLRRMYREGQAEVGTAHRVPGNALEVKELPHVDPRGVQLIDERLKAFDINEIREELLPDLPGGRRDDQESLEFTRFRQERGPVNFIVLTRVLESMFDTTDQMYRMLITRAEQESELSQDTAERMRSRICGAVKELRQNTAKHILSSLIRNHPGADISVTSLNEQVVRTNGSEVRHRVLNIGDIIKGVMAVGGVVKSTETFSVVREGGAVTDNYVSFVAQHGRKADQQDLNGPFPGAIETSGQEPITV